jgi:hypothetical protein
VERERIVDRETRREAPGGTAHEEEGGGARRDETRRDGEARKAHATRRQGNADGKTSILTGDVR